MPYISQEDRERLNLSIHGLALQVDGEGQLNYAITKLVHSYLHLRKQQGATINYAELNKIVGVLSGVKAEFYRKVVVPYEEKKITENGDIDVIDSLPTLSELDFCVRVNNCLRYLSDVRTTSDLLQMSPRDLLRIKNFGRQSLRDVRRKLALHGLHLKGE